MIRILFFLLLYCTSISHSAQVITLTHSRAHAHLYINEPHLRLAKPVVEATLVNTYQQNINHTNNVIEKIENKLKEIA